jgi:hypothetical protein
LTSIARGRFGEPTLPIVRQQDVGPITLRPNQSRTDWILTNVFKLFRQSLIMPHPMIEEISLPIDLRHSRRDSLKITDEAEKLGIAGNANQHVQVIWH